MSPGRYNREDQNQKYYIDDTHVPLPKVALHSDRSSIGFRKMDADFTLAVREIIQTAQYTLCKSIIHP
jgi:hypothetical protein